MLESLFNKVAGLQAVTLFKKAPPQSLFPEVCDIFYRTSPVTVSDDTLALAEDKKIEMLTRCAAYLNNRW